jgi:hypothetical protein
MQRVISDRQVLVSASPICGPLLSGGLSSFGARVDHPSQTKLVPCHFRRVPALLARNSCHAHLTSCPAGSIRATWSQAASTIPRNCCPSKVHMLEGSESTDYHDFRCDNQFNHLSSAEPAVGPAIPPLINPIPPTTKGEK